MTEKERKKAVLDILRETYPDAKPGLDFTSAFELLIATILSAQCTDVRVNKVTPELFREYPDARSMANAELSDIEELIRTCGMYKTKAANIKKTCAILAETYGGDVPGDRDALQSLPGVGRKTASVVLSNAFGVPAIAVDTHVFRVSNRLGLAKATTVEKTEEQLMKNIPKKDWSIAHHWLIWHGRKICHARKPECGACTLREVCKEYIERSILDGAENGGNAAV